MGSPDYEMDIILEETGKVPAMRGLDYMNNDFKGVNERAIKWWNEGGLVTICWHTGVKSSGYNESLGDNPDFDKMLTEGTEEYNTLMESWVLGYSGEVKNGWYPGDEYCDIIGSDTYDNSTHKKAWVKLLDVSETGKPIAFHECGNVPLPSKFESDGCIWSWFMIWHTDFISNHNPDTLNEVYNSELVITRDELPEF